MSEEKMTAEEVEIAAESMQRALSVLSLIQGMLSAEDLELIRRGCDFYEEQTRAHRVLADMFGRSAINQTDANVMAKIPTLRKLAELLESIHTLEERERLDVHGEELWKFM